jgi:hypothetical protein
MTQSVDLELDHLARELTQHLERALIAARRAAQSRTAQRQATPVAVRTPADVSRSDADLAARYRLEAMAARWAAADAQRSRDPQTAAAWDERVRDAGIDPTRIIATTLGPGGPDTGLDRDLSGDPTSDVVTEHLSEVYTDQAADWVDAGGQRSPREPTVAELIAASSPPSAVTDRSAPGIETHRSPQHRGLARTADRATAQDTGLDR